MEAASGASRGDCAQHTQSRADFTCSVSAEYSGPPDSKAAGQEDEPRVRGGRGRGIGGRGPPGRGAGAAAPSSGRGAPPPPHTGREAAAPSTPGRRAQPAAALHRAAGQQSLVHKRWMPLDRPANSGPGGGMKWTHSADEAGGDRNGARSADEGGGDRSWARSADGARSAQPAAESSQSRDSGQGGRGFGGQQHPAGGRMGGRRGAAASSYRGLPGQWSQDMGSGPSINQLGHGGDVDSIRPSKGPSSHGLNFREQPDRNTASGIGRPGAGMREGRGGRWAQGGRGGGKDAGEQGGRGGSGHGPSAARGSYKRRSGIPQLVQELEEKLMRGQVECMICCDRVGRRAPVWSCTSCWTIFHLTCIRKWAASPTSAASAPAPALSLQPHPPRGSGGDSWRCPGCQAVVPKTASALLYYCFCGKLREPPDDTYLTPHSCGEPCGRPLDPRAEDRTDKGGDRGGDMAERDGDRADRGRTGTGCPHRCTMHCHPGPHPPCAAMAPLKACFCGRTSRRVRCGDPILAEGFSCGGACGRLLACGVHKCERECHGGECGTCKEVVVGRCFCGKKEEALMCCKSIQDGINVNEPVSTSGIFACGFSCAAPLACGHHACPNPCHRGPCPPCRGLPAAVATCPCGKVRLSDMPAALPRASCLDPIPTCKAACGRPMPCGHECRAPCHEGPCPPCPRTVDQVCRCGAETRQVRCQVAGSGALVCERVCGQKKRCGRHRCNLRCCWATRQDGRPAVAVGAGVIFMDPDASGTVAGANAASGQHGQGTDPHRAGVDNQASATSSRASLMDPYVFDIDPHLCTLVCGKKLRCGLHTCEELCHPAHCPPCPNVSFEELSCACGQAVIPPPVPCSTPPPACARPCQRPQPCAHQSTHLCHPSEACPPCTVPVSRPCSGGHVVLRNVPCGSRDLHCASPCGRPRRCGLHSCSRPCHAPPCDPDDEFEIVEAVPHNGASGRGQAWLDARTGSGTTVGPTKATERDGSGEPNAFNEVIGKAELGGEIVPITKAGPSARTEPNGLSRGNGMVGLTGFSAHRPSPPDGVPTPDRATGGLPHSSVGNPLASVSDPPSAIAAGGDKASRNPPGSAGGRMSGLGLTSQESEPEASSQNAGREASSRKGPWGRIGTTVSCGQVCGAKRSDCGHPCKSCCHPGTLCPLNLCQETVQIACTCGRFTAEVCCGAGTNSSAAATTAAAAATAVATTAKAAAAGTAAGKAAATGMAEAKAEATGAMAVSGLGKGLALEPVVPGESDRVPLGQRRLACDEECMRLERKYVLASAFGATLPGTCGPSGEGEALLEAVRRMPEWVAAVEARLQAIGSSRSASDLRLHVFQSMPQERRHLVHLLGERWGVATHSAGMEPHRFVTAHAKGPRGRTVSQIRPLALRAGTTGAPGAFGPEGTWRGGTSAPGPAGTTGPSGTTVPVGTSGPSTAQNGVIPALSDMDMDPACVVEFRDLPRDANPGASLLRFGGECEVVWLTDRHVVAVFRDPVRAATAMRYLEHARGYRGVVTIPQARVGETGRGANGWGRVGLGTPGPAPWGGGGAVRGARKKLPRQWLEDAWGEDEVNTMGQQREGRPGSAASTQVGNPSGGVCNEPTWRPRGEGLVLKQDNKWAALEPQDLAEEARDLELALRLSQGRGEEAGDEEWVAVRSKKGVKNSAEGVNRDDYAKESVGSLQVDGVVARLQRGGTLDRLPVELEVEGTSAVQSDASLAKGGEDASARQLGTLLAKSLPATRSGGATPRVGPLVGGEEKAEKDERSDGHTVEEVADDWEDVFD